MHRVPISRNHETDRIIHPVQIYRQRGRSGNRRRALTQLMTIDGTNTSTNAPPGRGQFADSRCCISSVTERNALPDGSSAAS